MKFRKAISIFLTALMLISMSLLPAFAFSEKNEPEIITVSPQLYLSSENSRYAEDVLSAYVDIDLLRACISEGISKAQSVCA